MWGSKAEQAKGHICTQPRHSSSSSPVCSVRSICSQLTHTAHGWLATSPHSHHSKLGGVQLLCGSSRHIPSTQDPKSTPASRPFPLPSSKPQLGLPAPALTQPLPTLRILQELCKSLGLNLTKFTQYDENTWTEVNDMKLRNYVVEKMPEKLGYNLRPREKGHSPEEIYQMALHKVGGPTSFSTPTFCAPLSWLSLMSHGLLPLAPPARSFPSPLHALLDHLTFD